MLTHNIAGVIGLIVLPSLISPPEFMNQFEWRTKEGKYMLPSDMDDNHLLNSIKMLQRNIPKGAEQLIAEDDTDNMDGRVDVMNRRELLKSFGYYKLLAEKRRRKVIN